MTTCNISLTDELAKLLDKEMATGKFANKSECIRSILRKYFYTSSIYKEEFIEGLEDAIDEVKTGKTERIHHLEDLLN